LFGIRRRRLRGQKVPRITDLQGVFLFPWGRSQGSGRSGPGAGRDGPILMPFREGS
jgi:hypothetical protein